MIGSSRGTRKMRGAPQVDTRYAVIDANGEIVIVIAWDGKRAYTPPDGHTLMLIDPAQATTMRIGAR